MGRVPLLGKSLAKSYCRFTLNEMGSKRVWPSMRRPAFVKYFNFTFLKSAFHPSGEFAGARSGIFSSTFSDQTHVARRRRDHFVSQLAQHRAHIDCGIFFKVH
jgi:hypothetical protein